MKVLGWKLAAPPRDAGCRKRKSSTSSLFSQLTLFTKKKKIKRLAMGQESNNAAKIILIIEFGEILNYS